MHMVYYVLSLFFIIFGDCLVLSGINVLLIPLTTALDPSSILKGVDALQKHF